MSVQFGAAAGWVLRKEVLRQFGVLDIYQGSIPVKGRREKQDWANEKVSFNAGPTKCGSTPKGALEQILPTRVTCIKPKLLGLYVVASLCHWV